MYIVKLYPLAELSLVNLEFVYMRTDVCKEQCVSHLFLCKAELSRENSMPQWLWAIGENGCYDDCQLLERIVCYDSFWKLALWKY